MKSALERRAEVALLNLIEMERYRRSAPKRPPWQRARVWSSDPEEADLRERESFRFSLEALTAIGAVPESEGGDWLARFEYQPKARQRRPEVVPDRETKSRAQALLEERLPASHLDPKSEEYRDAIWRFQEAQAAVNVAGALPYDERARWQERFLEHLAPEDRRRLHNPPPCRGISLERVVPGPPTRHDGLRVTHVELYSDGLVVHLHHAVEFPTEPGRELTGWERFQASKFRGPPMIDLADDAGTSYRWWPGPNHDAVFRRDGFVQWWSATFIPAVPEEATRLYASREGNTFDIPLTP